MKDIIIIAVLLVIVILAVGYIVKSKKNGKKCIGCPVSCCPNKGAGTCGCHKEN